MCLSPLYLTCKLDDGLHNIEMQSPEHRIRPEWTAK
jgi:hypothetical protein